MQQLGDISVEQAGVCSWERAAGFRCPGGILGAAAAEPDTSAQKQPFPLLAQTANSKWEMWGRGWSGPCPSAGTTLLPSRISLSRTNRLTLKLTVLSFLFKGQFQNRLFCALKDPHGYLAPTLLT